MKILRIIFDFKTFSLLFVCAFWFTASHALVLEDLIQTRTLESTLQGKNVCYYLGSFDPLHKGHEAVAELPIKQGLCNYVLIYPSWGGDSWKTRADVKARLEMLFVVFKDHQNVIVTKLKPKDLQQTLTVPDLRITTNNKPVVKPAFVGMNFIGLIGSDTALLLGSNKEAASTFMAGIEISTKYAAHTLGGCMALPVNSFIVAMRAHDNLASLNGKIYNRAILAVIESDNEQTVSSTKVKKKLKQGHIISTMLSKSVIEIITKYDLYKELKTNQ